jgi:hypothetical protein
MVWFDPNPARPMGKAEIVVAPMGSERPAPAPARKPTVIVTRAAPRETRPDDAARGRGRVIDILA